MVIGLFGTCGTSTWRIPFMTAYDAAGISYFNPQVENWSPECADIEARHLAKDEIILFPVTAETYGLGSLAESGFSILQVLRSLKQRHLIIMIDPLPDETLRADEKLFKESQRARTLVLAHLSKLSIPNVSIVQSLDEMYECSLWVVQNAKDLAA